jgi:metallophosphoesterase (TIGR03767 family)
MRPGPAGRGGWRPLRPGPGEPHVVRTDLTPASARAGRPLLVLAHLSDLHLCDAQSPARVELLDRWADPDSPVLAQITEIGTYRPQEIMTAQVADAAVRAINDLGRGPVSGAPIDLAVVTGDNTDNAQANELEWYLTLLDGGTVVPDSGDRTRWEGVADEQCFDERFWHPGGSRGDLPRDRWGFPSLPGLLDAVRAPFDTPGLAMPWLAVHGNHDRLLQGTVPVELVGPAAATGSAKLIGLPSGLDEASVLALLTGLENCDPSAVRLLADGVFRQVTPDAGRRVVTRAEFVAAHERLGARPPRHGFTGSTAYYRFDHGPVSVLVLDTVNEHGGWQGSLDGPQCEWLAEQLAEADAERRYVVLASHHTLDTLINPTVAPGGSRRVLRDDLLAVLDGHRSLVLWLNGHTHCSTVTPRGSWWEVTTPSLIDWPQQTRLVELLRDDGTLGIATTMVDHAGDADPGDRPGAPAQLAGLSRLLAANDWQTRELLGSSRSAAGRREDRNVLLTLPDPW